MPKPYLFLPCFHSWFFPSSLLPSFHKSWAWCHLGHWLSWTPFSSDKNNGELQAVALKGLPYSREVFGTALVWLVVWISLHLPPLAECSPFLQTLSFVPLGSFLVCWLLAYPTLLLLFLQFPDFWLWTIYGCSCSQTCLSFPK